MVSKFVMDMTEEAASLSKRFLPVSPTFFEEFSENDFIEAMRYLVEKALVIYVLPTIEKGREEELMEALPDICAEATSDAINSGEYDEIFDPEEETEATSFLAQFLDETDGHKALRDAINSINYSVAKKLVENNIIANGLGVGHWNLDIHGVSTNSPYIYIIDVVEQ